MSFPWLYIAWLGDLVVIGPLFIGLCLIMCFMRRQREVASWLLAFVLCAACIYLLKLVGTFYFLIGQQEIHARSAPSGHVTMGLIFYGQLTVMLWEHARTRLRRLLAALPMALTLIIDFAVYHVGWHSLFDIATGLTLGTGFLIALSFFHRLIMLPWQPKGPRHGGTRRAEMWRNS